MSTLPSREPINLVLQYANQRVQARDSLCLCVKRSMSYGTANEHDRGFLTDRVALTVEATQLWRGIGIEPEIGSVQDNQFHRLEPRAMGCTL